MLKTAMNVKIRPQTMKRLDDLAQATKKTRSSLTEEALEAYLEVKEWQLQGILEAIKEADDPTAEWTDHAALKAKWQASRD